MKYTIEADPKSTERPVFSVERMGVGIMCPKGDMRVIIRRRQEPQVVERPIRVV